MGGPLREPQVQNPDTRLLLPCIFCLFAKAGFHIVQASPKLDMYLRLSLNYSSFCIKWWDYKQVSPCLAISCFHNRRKWDVCASTLRMCKKTGAVTFHIWRDLLHSFFLSSCHFGPLPVSSFIISIRKVRSHGGKLHLQIPQLHRLAHSWGSVARSSGICCQVPSWHRKVGIFSKGW